MQDVSSGGPAPEKEIEGLLPLVRASLRAPQIDAIETKRLREEPCDSWRSGSKPLSLLVDEEGSRYVLKQGDPPLLAAEQAAYQLRRLARRPAIPASLVTLQLLPERTVSGLIKPFLHFPEQQLSTDTTEWTPLQRNVMLLEHAWEWFLDNMDTNTSQYALLTEAAYPVNIDWDRSFFSDAQSEFSRFEKYKATLPNARTFLYADYVEGRVDLPFFLLEREARCIQNLDPIRVRRIVEGFARAKYEDSQQAQMLVQRVLRRQRRIQRAVARFVLELELERLRFRLSKRAGLAWRLLSLRAIAWHHLQGLLHQLLHGPVGSLARNVLRWSRAKALARAVER